MFQTTISSILLEFIQRNKQQISYESVISGCALKHFRISVKCYEIFLLSLKQKKTF